MPHKKHRWPQAITTFFETHPMRQFFVGEVELDAIRAASAAGWIYALASQPSSDSPEVRFLAVYEGMERIPVVVRRASHAEGYPSPRMIVMDAGFPLPPFNLIPDPAQHDLATESFGSFVWDLAEETRKNGRTIHDAFGEFMMARLARAMR